MILRTENGTLEQRTVPCFVMLCGITNIKYTEQIIGSALFFMKKRWEYIKNEPFAFAKGSWCG